MAGTNVNVGTGSTIGFGTSTFTAQLLSVEWSGISREVVDTTHFDVDTTPGTTTFGNATFIPVDIAEGGEVTIEVQFNPDLTPPMVPGTVAASETITVTFPLVGAEAAPDWEFEGYCKNMDIAIPFEGVMTATLTIRVTAGVTITAAV